MKDRPFLTSARRQHAATLFIVLTLLVVGFAAQPPTLHAATATLNWSLPPQNLTANVSKSYYPRIVTDSANHYHIIVGTEDNLLYFNNVSGSFSAPQSIVKDLGANRDRFFDMAIGPDGSLHVVYSLLKGEVKHGYYVKGTLSGATATWSLPQEVTSIPGESKAYMSSVAVDSAGNVHMTWFDDSKSTYNVAYRERFADGTLGETSYPRAESKSEDLGKNAQVVVTKDDKVHIIYTRGSDLLYARRDGSNWTIQKLSSSRSLNPSFATDGTNLYAAWDAQGISLRRSLDGGNTWSNTIALANKDVYNTYPEVAWAGASTRVYVAWSDQSGYDEESGELDIWYREFDPGDGTTTDARQLNQTNNISVWPEIAAGPNQVAMTWQEGSDVDFTTSQLVAVSKCTGSLVLENGATITKNSTVSGVVTPDQSCNPTEMQISVDTPPTASTAKVAYSSTISANVPSGGCAHTVYVQLYQNGGTGAAATSTIKVKADATVNAVVQGMNPHMKGMSNYTTLRTADIAPQDGNPGGASNGSPNYTRDRLMLLSVEGSNNCADLKSLVVTGSISGTINNSRYLNSVPLPGDPTVGSKSFSVQLSDMLGNTQTYSSSVIYDPADTDTSTYTNTEGLPVLDTTTVSPTVTGPSSANSILVPLNFSNISVRDNVYGQAEGLEAGKQFWGVWIANSRNDNDGDNPDLNWSPVEVANPDASFNLTWNLFNGITDSASLTNRAGDYYVYVRFLDGAGNPSKEVLKAKISLQAGYSVLNNYLPLTGR